MADDQKSRLAPPSSLPVFGFSKSVHNTSGFLPCQLPSVEEGLMQILAARETPACLQPLLATGYSVMSSLISPPTLLIYFFCGLGIIQFPLPGNKSERPAASLLVWSRYQLVIFPFYLFSFFS